MLQTPRSNILTAMNELTELPSKPSLDQSQKIYNNHQRQQELLQKSGGIVIAYHGTSTQDAQTILQEGFNGTNSYPGGNENMLYRPENAVWFQEETELPNVLSTASIRYPQGYAVVKAELHNPNIDPLWRPFWVINKYKKVISE